MRTVHVPISYDLTPTDYLAALMSDFWLDIIESVPYYVPLTLEQMIEMEYITTFLSPLPASDGAFW